MKPRRLSARRPWHSRWPPCTPMWIWTALFLGLLAVRGHYWHHDRHGRPQARPRPGTYRTTVGGRPPPSPSPSPTTVVNRVPTSTTPRPAPRPAPVHQPIEGHRHRGPPVLVPGDGFGQPVTGPGSLQALPTGLRLDRPRPGEGDDLGSPPAQAAGLTRVLAQCRQSAAGAPARSSPSGPSVDRASPRRAAARRRRPPLPFCLPRLRLPCAYGQ